MADQNQQRQDRRPAIEILNDPPVRREDSYELTIWVVVKRDNNLLDGITVRIFCSGRDVGSATTNEGRTNPLMISLPVNTISAWIEAVIDDDDDRLRGASKRKQITIQPVIPMSKRADEWSTRVVGSEGKYTAYVSVTGQNQLPLEGVLIHVYADRDDNLVGNGYSNKDGLAIISIPKFTEPFKDIIIEAVGTRIKQKKERLYRRHNQRPPKISEPPEEHRTSGFRNALRALWNGWKHGSRLLEERDRNETQP